MSIRHGSRKWSLAALAVLLLTAGAQAAHGVEVRHVGSITAGVTAPTSLVVGPDYVAALEPYTQQLVTYTSDGIATRTVELATRAAALDALDASRYLFCEAERGQVTLLNLSSGQQSVFLAGLGDPRGLVVTGTEVFVLDADRAMVLITDRQGNLLEQVVLAAPGLTHESWFSALAWDSGREVFQLLDQTNSRVVTYDRQGAVLGTMGAFGAGDGEFTRGGEVLCDAGGWVYVVDRYQGQVVVFDATGDFMTRVNPVDLGLERLQVPVGLAIDGDGFLYVSATEGAAIQIFHLDKSAGPVPALLARPVSPGSGAELALNQLRFVAGLQGPADLAGNLMADFRLVARADTATVLGSANGVVAADETVVGDLLIASATWRPELNLTAGTEYGWQARARSNDQQGTWMAFNWFVPTAVRLPYRLDQNSPNPFNPRTIISFNLAGDGPARLRVFDIRGHQVWTRDVGSLGVGTHQLPWQGVNNTGAALPSGIYFYRLEAGQFSETRKMVLTR